MVVDVKIEAKKTYRCPHEAERGADINNRQRSSLLLSCFTTTATHPTKQDRVDSVRADSEETHGKVTGADVECTAGENKAEDGNCFGDGDVPCSLIKVTGRGGPENGDAAGDKVGWAGEYECDGGIEAEGVNDGRELEGSA